MMTKSNSLFFNYTLIMLMFCVSQKVDALSIDIPPFSETLEEAAIVARIEVTGEKPLATQNGGGIDVCGYMYTANVIENFKGESRSFVFFSPYVIEKIKPTSEYLIIAFTANRNHTNLCMPKNSKHFIKKVPQSLYEFDSLAAKKYRGNWLRLKKYNSISENEAKLKTLKSDCEEKYYVLRWSDVRNRILAILPK